LIDRRSEADPVATLQLRGARSRPSRSEVRLGWKQTSGWVAAQREASTAMREVGSPGMERRRLMLTASLPARA